MTQGRKSILREAMKNLLRQHFAQGIEFSEIERRFGAVDRSRLIKLLDNLRQAGEARCERSEVGKTARWFPGAGGAKPATEAKRTQRARLLDRIQPLEFYGERLTCGRCASVWQYAAQFQSAGMNTEGVHA